MSAPVFDAGALEDGWPSAELDDLRSAIVQRLREAGVALPDADVAALAEEMLADAVRIGLAWMERQ